MKKIILFLAIAALASSCKKENLSDAKDQLHGEWEFIQFSGYGNFPPPLPPGNGRIIAFSRNGSFERRSHDTILFKGGYQLQMKKDCSGDPRTIFLKTNDPDFTNNFVIHFRSDTLYIGTSSCLVDGGSSIYRKL